MDDTHKRVNGDASVSKKSSVPTRYHQFMTSEDEARSQSSSAHSSEDEKEEEGDKSTAKSIISAQSVSPVPPNKSEAPVSPAPAKETSQVLTSCSVEYSQCGHSLNVFLALW